MLGVAPVSFPGPAKGEQFHLLLLLPRDYAVHIFVLLSLDTFVYLQELSLGVLWSSILILEQLPV